jgi:hypothetical protein
MSNQNHFYFKSGCVLCGAAEAAPAAAAAAAAIVVVAKKNEVNECVRALISEVTSSRMRWWGWVGCGW